MSFLWKLRLVVVNNFSDDVHDNGELLINGGDKHSLLSQ